MKLIKKRQIHLGEIVAGLIVCIALFGVFRLTSNTLIRWENAQLRSKVASCDFALAQSMEGKELHND